MGWLKNFGKWLFNIEDTQTTYPLGEELIRRDKIIKALQQQVKAREAQLARIFAERKEKSEEEKQKEYSQKVAEKLEIKEKDISEKRFKNAVSLGKFFNTIITNKKFRNELEVTDYEGKTIFGKFGDIFLLPDGYIGITTRDGMLRAYGRMLHQIIWKPDSLHTYLNRKMIPLALDENLRYVKDYLNEQASDVFIEEGGIRETKMYQDTVKELLIKRDNLIREKNKIIEIAEKSTLEMRQRNEDLKREISIFKDGNEKLKVELSSIAKTIKSTQKKMEIMEEQIVISRNLKNVTDKLNGKYREIIKKLLEKLEYHGDKTMHDIVLGEMEDSIEFYSAYMREERKESKAEAQIQIAQPGQALTKIK